MAHLKDKLIKALQYRESLFQQETLYQTNTFRLLSEGTEGVSGLAIDRFGSTAIFSLFEGKQHFKENDIKSMAVTLLESTPLKSVLLKRFVADRSHEVAAPPCEVIAGEPVAEVIVAEESGLKYSIKPFEGFSVGLFLDQRDNRREVARLDAKKFLNCFSYTCGFSLALAKRGCRVTNVDLSKKYLNWGKENFVLNGINPESHAFLEGDVFDFLKRFQKRSEKFHAIVLDPPSFSRDRAGNVFSVVKDWQKLLAEASFCLEDGGTLFFSTNYQSATFQDFEKKLTYQDLQKMGLKRLPNLPPPLDFSREKNPLITFWFRKVTL